MKIIKLLLLVSILASCTTENTRNIDSVIESTFEMKTISKGNNHPKIDISQDSLFIFLTALHFDIPINEITSKLNWDKEETDKNIKSLIENNLLVKNENKYTPNLGIFTIERGNRLIEKTSTIANEIADSLIGKISTVKKMHHEMSVSRRYEFQELSFFYLSNIILDMAQINNVEKEFLKKERPLRNGVRYYSAILEKDSSEITEPFRLYGNQGLWRSDSTYIGVYGNTRTEANIGWNSYENKNVHYFSKSDLDFIVNKMPEIFLPTLLNILERNKPYLLSVYKTLEFENETSFEEFFIWWYHFIYSETTDILIRKGQISKPESGLFYYELKMK
ncbi:hypothetical protein [Ancylomarina euxinus]|nr:hypothetical protein [Ancylomarina euxinus]MCZ4696467.1 hypothetical protein [Ancylomarina euxinus]MUP16834.1 hypothetical protein [Ancylomarina euxinus]